MEERHLQLLKRTVQGTHEVVGDGKVRRAFSRVSGSEWGPPRLETSRRCDGSGMGVVVKGGKRKRRSTQKDIYEMETKRR